MLSIKRALLVPGFALALVTGGLVTASPASADDKIVAKVNGTAITETDL
ncbi:MAG: hypothetical protein JSS20_19850, partial [Proteobacteria bacterium]|nr:hypothetical protein [Pseudomonadota bacterium]